MEKLVNGDAPQDVFTNGGWTMVGDMLALAINNGKYKIIIFDKNDEYKYELFFYNGKVLEKNTKDIGTFDVGTIEMHKNHIHIIYPYNEYFMRVLLPTFIMVIVCFMILCFFIITEKEKTANIMEMHENKRFKSLVHLTAGIAHNFRNDLSVLVGQLKMLRKESMAKLPERPFIRKKVIDRIDVMEPVLANMAESITKIRRFTKEDYSEDKVNIIEIIRNTLDMFDQTTEKNVTLKLKNRYINIMCKAKRQNLSTVFLNILNNAYEAMDEFNKNNTIIISVDICDNYAVIKFKDNGKGMTTETKMMAFVPFYTNKSSGTGLGLSTSKSFIEQAGGKMEIAFSAIGEGTIMQVELPICSYQEDNNINKSDYKGA